MEAFLAFLLFRGRSFSVLGSVQTFLNGKLFRRCVFIKVNRLQVIFGTGKRKYYAAPVAGLNPT